MFANKRKIICIANLSLLTDFQCPGDGTCSNQGICNVLNGTCHCDCGFQGETCEGKNFLHLFGGCRL